MEERKKESPVPPNLKVRPQEVCVGVGCCVNLFFYAIQKEEQKLSTMSKSESFQGDQLEKKKRP